MAVDETTITAVAHEEDATLLVTCIKLTLGWVNDRSFTPVAQLVCSTIPFGIVEDTSSNPTWNISFKMKCLRVSIIINIYVSLGPQD